MTFSCDTRGVGSGSSALAEVCRLPAGWPFAAGARRVSCGMPAMSASCRRSSEAGPDGLPRASRASACPGSLDCAVTGVLAAAGGWPRLPEVWPPDLGVLFGPEVGAVPSEGVAAALVVVDRSALSGRLDVPPRRLTAARAVNGLEAAWAPFWTTVIGGIGGGGGRPRGAPAPPAGGLLGGGKIRP